MYQNEMIVFFFLNYYGETPVIHKKINMIGGALLGLGSVLTIPAHAANDTIKDLIKIMHENGQITDEQYKILLNGAKADEEQTAAVKNDLVAEVEEKTKNLPKITTKGKLKIESQDGEWSFQPIGRVMWDAMSVDSDGSGRDEFQGTELRRARLGFEGEIYDWGYKFEGDFANGKTAIKDAFVSYGTKFGDNKFKVKLGQSQIAFGFNTAASSKYMTFMDRPWFADSALSPARESGIAAKLSGHSWSLASSITIGEFESGITEDDIDGTTYALRGTFLPFQQDKMHLIQIGAGYRRVTSNKNGFSYSQHLVAHKDHNKIKLGNSIAAADFDGIDNYEVDAVGIYGPFHALAEYNKFSADSSLANNDVDIDSYAIEAGYFLTGESMKLKHGFWDGITPKSQLGAWQVAARYESMNIDDSVAGDDKASKWTIGLNYYPTKNTRLMLNYDNVIDWDQNGLDQNAEPSAIKFRAQAKW